METKQSYEITDSLIQGIPLYYIDKNCFFLIYAYQVKNQNYYLDCV
jgi:hypothetical protein